MLFGLITVTAGNPAIPLNGVVTTSAPVVMVTLRDPTTAVLAMVIGTDALLGPFTVTVPAVILAPKLTVVVGPKWVLNPVITIVWLEPWCAEDGFSTAAGKLFPVPESGMSSGFGLLVLGTVSEPTIGPRTVGANWTWMLQLWAAVSTPPVSGQVVRLSWIWKSAEDATLLRVTALALLLLILTAFAVLVEPIGCDAKASLGGVNVRLSSELPLRL